MSRYWSKRIKRWTYISATHSPFGNRTSFKPPHSSSDSTKGKFCIAVLPLSNNEQLWILKQQEQDWGRSEPSLNVADRRTECECTVKECLEWCLLSHPTGSQRGKQVRQHWSFPSRQSKSQREGQNWHLCKVGTELHSCFHVHKDRTERQELLGEGECPLLFLFSCKDTWQNGEQWGNEDL